MALDATHDPARRSWVDSANAAGCDFPIQNLPFGVFRREGEEPRGGVAIGEMILDLRAGLAAGLFEGAAREAAEAASGPALNPLMALGRGVARALRARLSELLWADGAERRRAQAAAGLLVPMREAELLLPARVGNFTDFMASIDHSGRLGAVARPESPLPPAFRYLPVAYNSRATTVVVSGAPVRRPLGIARREDKSVGFGPCAALDYELEFGVFVGPGNAMGEPLSMRQARERLWGYCLVNDWSARDIQRFEMAPLGPFLAKSLATSISPWVVTADALAPFACPARAIEPPPLPHLDSAENRESGGFDIALEAWLATPSLREPHRLTATNFRHMYWSFAQMLTHHASNGCKLETGDLLASGTTSGPEDHARACLAEINLTGPVTLPNGETRSYLEDGDEVIFRGRAEREGFVPIGFGECRARVLPAASWPQE